MKGQLFTTQKTNGTTELAVGAAHLADWSPVVTYIAGPDPVKLRADEGYAIYAASDEGVGAHVLISDHQVEVYLADGSLLVVGDGQRVDIKREIADVKYDHPLYRMVASFIQRHNLTRRHWTVSRDTFDTRTGDRIEVEMATFAAPGTAYATDDFPAMRDMLGPFWELNP